MFFDAHAIAANHYAAHKSSKMSDNVGCGYPAKDKHRAHHAD